MIDRPALVAWRSKAPWPTPVQIEQDLLLSRLMIEIASDDVLGPELAMRGGTLVHVSFDAEPTEGIGRIRIKIEMNIAETESHRPRTAVRHTVQTSWWSGEAEIPTFEPTELLATKLRALYQRSKGRDLFDLWLGLTVLEADRRRSSPASTTTWATQPSATRSCATTSWRSSPTPASGMTSMRS